MLLTCPGSLCESSRAPYGARGLKYTTDDIAQNVNGSRAPYGARGLKCQDWKAKQPLNSRAPYGARGLKYRQFASLFGHQRRAPYGARGLKYVKQNGCGSRD